MDDLLSNVVEYSGFRPVKVSAEEHGEQVRIRVRDHGSGVHARKRERIFSCFKRAVGRGKRWSGFGVGLWVVRQLAEAMGGAVVVEDALGGDALFTVILPRHVAGAYS